MLIPARGRLKAILISLLSNQTGDGLFYLMQQFADLKKTE
jgi:hypothetical protein